MHKDAALTGTIPPAHYDVIVIGGGMVGLTLALMLERELPQKKICVFESELVPSHDTPSGFQLGKQPSFDSRSTALSVSSLDILRGMGLWDGLSKSACEINCVSVTDAGHIGATGYSKEQNSGKELGYVVGNADLGRSLNTAIRSSQNIQLIDGVQVKSIIPTASGNRIEVQQNQGGKRLEAASFTSELTVIADGVNSPLRGRLGIDVDRQSYHQHAVVANIETQFPHQGKAYERFTPKGPLALLPLADSVTGLQENSCRSALVWTCPESEIEDRLGMNETDFIKKLQQSFGFRQGEIIRVGKRASYPLELVVAKEQVRTGIVLMGNAAHFLHPVAGQGFNLALRDAAKLCESLKRSLGKDILLGDLSVLQDYVMSQESDQWLTTYISHSFHRLFGDKALPLKAVRNLGLISMELIPDLKHAFFDQMMGRGFPKAKIGLL